MERPTVLIVGAGSMLGSSLRRLLEQQDVAVVATGRTQGDVLYDLASLAPPPPIRSKLDAVFVCAAAFGDDSWEHCITNAQVNATAMFRIAESAATAGCKSVIHASSISAYQPDSSYGLTKSFGEQILQWAGRSTKLTATSIRLPQLCDDQGRCSAHQPWFARIVSSAAKGLNLRLAPNDYPRNFLHVEDAARVMYSAWRQSCGGVRTVIAPTSHTYRQIAELAYDVFGRGGSVFDDSTMRPFREGSRAVLADPLAARPEWPVITLRETFERIGAHDLANRFEV
jgi:nucleoside-diphosphate-sugar epimerase